MTFGARAFSLIETAAALAVIGILAAISVAGFRAVETDTHALDAEMTVGQVARVALSNYLITRTWSSSVTSAIGELNITRNDFSPKEDVATLLGDRTSNTFGVISWRADGTTLGVAMANHEQGCSYALIDTSRNMTSWTTQDTQSVVCAGRYALAGKPSTNMTTTTDPDSQTQVSTTLTATSTSSTTATLTWVSVQGAATYEVARNGIVETSNATGTTYIDSSVIGGEVYSYTLTPLTSSGRHLSQMGPSSVLTIPNTPTGAGAQIRTTGVYLAWPKVAGQVDGYKLYRDGTQIYAGTRATFQDALVNRTGQHTYTIAAYNQTGSSAPSSAVTVTF